MKPLVEEIKQRAAEKMKDQPARDTWQVMSKLWLKNRAEYSVSILDLLIYDKEAFVKNLYECLLGRLPSSSDVSSILAHLEDGSIEKKIEIIRAILNSPELKASKRDIEIIGIQSFERDYASRIGLKKNIFKKYESLIKASSLVGLSQAQVQDLYKRNIISRKELDAYFSTSDSKRQYFQSIEFRVIRKLLRPLINLKKKFSNYFFEPFIRLDFFIDTISQTLLKWNFEKNKIYELLNKKLGEKSSYIEVSGKKIETKVLLEETYHRNLKLDKIYDLGDFNYDQFYMRYEEKFRGSEDLVKERLKPYLKYCEEAFSDNQAKLPILDLGFGRGEWLSLVKEHGYECEGIDLNIEFVSNAQKKGFTVRHGNAIDLMCEMPSQSYSMITAFQLVEHLSNNNLHKLIQESYRLLKEGGLLIFETPNAENMLVGSFEFWMDPTHVRPIPYNVLKFIVESHGFQNVEIEKVNPNLMFADEGLKHAALENIIYRFNLEKDYAVIARRS